MKTLLTTLLVLFLSDYSFAQTDTLRAYKIREFGVNTTPFLQQFVSVGDIDAQSIARAFTYKRFKAGKKRAFRFSLGVFFDDDSFSLDGQLVHISLGGERRRTINNNLYYYFGYDGFINARPGFNDEDIFGNGVGADIVLGLVYQINKHISLSTETTFAATLGESLSFKLTPPLALYFNFRTFKKTYY